MTVDRTFVIADLAGFTAAVDVHGDEAADRLALGLEGAARDALGETDELVKTMGDAVLVASSDPADAVGFARRLFDRYAAEDEDLPMLRVGAHLGSAVRRDGDYFGSGVNVAARVADLAASCQLLGTDAVADAARALGVGVVELGDYALRHVAQPVVLYEIDCGHHVRGHTVDPVCQMRVERSRAVASLRHAGREYWFCSLECVARFAESPEQYASD